MALEHHITSHTGEPPMFGSLSTLGPLLTALGAFLKSVPTESLSGKGEGSSTGSLSGLSSGSAE
ncbi:hypothetical protein BS618_28260 [Rhodococcus erythropolis]|jgi:hypothetical protein|nr:hypothetical protein A0W34_07080 [Rhodococcus sp. BH4]AZI60920.1 hypothetical protein EHW12_07065 [Rhodococcus sp. NJ-530]EQM31115.1 hypothetical protein N601_23800 [Rhodococcus erythropolis DN1]KSU71805.1 hypothetical protein AS032_22995 [Rhodococcus qingshengii]KZF13084.1 hypothetical protein A2J01_14615 [Rhodococcus sp. EPR-134]MCE4163804.1 hypothetical protein [Rhodococcus sp. Ni2]MYV26918.1 hypothetical protein [Rhodococcus erythropolis]